MRICIVTDTHLGVRNNSNLFLDVQKSFWSNLFFPYIDKHNIDTIVHLGDYFDNRKYVSHLCLERNREDFLKPFLDRNLKMYIIAGNHDCYYFNTNKLNSLRTVLGNIPNIHIIDNDLEIISLDGKTKSLFVPWLNDENFEDFVFFKEKEKVSHVFGHFGINGFEIAPGQIETHGLEKELFAEFPIVFSGHFHKKSSSKHIHYLGSPYQTTWSDYGNKHGFHIFDTETNKLEFIHNKDDVFHILKYNEQKINIIEKNLYTLSNKYVKILIEKKTEESVFNAFLKKLNSYNPANLTIVDDYNMNLIESNIEIDETESTIDIIDKYIDKIKDFEHSKQLKKYVQNLYNVSMKQII